METVTTNREEYRRLQRLWVKNNNITKGDKVLIVDKAQDHQAGWGSVWVPPMDRTVGNVGTVMSISACGIRVGNSYPWDWNYPFFVLVKVEDEPDEELPPVSGTFANHTGNRLERFVQHALDDHGYTEFWNHKEQIFENRKTVGGNVVYNSLMYESS